MALNPNLTYRPGDVVQILPKEKVLSFHQDNSGNYILGLHSNHINDTFDKEKLAICGCLAVITNVKSTMDDSDPYYDLASFNPDEDKTGFPWDEWYFSSREFRPFGDSIAVLSPPSISFDDLLKGGI